MKEELHTVIDLFERSYRKFPDNVYLWEKQNGHYQPTTYRQTHENVLHVAAGMLKLGLQKGDRVALLSEGCNDWVYAELGILYAGGINVPLSIKLNAAELIFRINHSGARFLIVSDHYKEMIRPIESEIPGIEKIFVIHYTSAETGKYNSFERLKDEGLFWQKAHATSLEQRLASVDAEDLANISYTSGTTAEPKGIMLSHKNYITNVLQADSLIQIPEHYKILLFLPWDHSFAHTVGIYSFMYNGASIASVDYGKSALEYLRNIPQNLKEIKPEVLLSVPALAKNFRKNIEAGISQKNWLIRKIYAWGLKTGYLYYGSGNHQGKGLRHLLAPCVKLADVLLFHRIRQIFGGHLKFFVGGGALLDKELQQYYRVLGVPMLQGYGLSEASPVISSNRPGYHRFGSSGEPVRPMLLKICDENGRELPKGEKGEIVIQGGNVMKGYWKNEKSTAEVIRDGWLYTGDMGYINEEGLLYVTGRFKSLLIAGDGEKYSPEGIEEAIVELSPYIEECILYNNQSPYTVGLIVPNKTTLTEYVLKNGENPGSIEAYKLMLNKIHTELMRFRKDGEFEGKFPERWLPAVVGILPKPLSEKDGTVNSTAKVVRHKVYEIYRTELDFIFTPEGKDIRNVHNTMNIKKFMGT